MGVIFALGFSQKLSADCTSPAGVAGTRENFSGIARFCDGTSWTQMFTDGSTGSCSNQGRWDWNSASSAYTYCNGTNNIRQRAPACTVTGVTYMNRRTSGDLNVANILTLSNDGTKAYVGSQFGHKLVVMDISAAPAAPTILGVTAANTNAGDWTDVKLVGNYIFGVARAGTNFFTVNVSNPAAPAFSGRVNLPTQMQNVWSLDVSADGNIAYTVGWASGPTANRCILNVIDTTNPASPTLITTYDITAAMGTSVQYCNNVRRYGDQLLVSYAEGGVARVSITNPTSPSYQSYATHASANSLEFSTFSEDGRHLYVLTTSSSRFYSWNVSGGTPTYVTNFQDTTRMQVASSIDLRGNYAFVTGKDSNTVSIINVANPASPSVTTSINHANMQSPDAVAVFGRYLFVSYSSGVNGLAVLDMGCDPISTGNLGTCSTAGQLEYFPNARSFGYCDGSAYRIMGQSPGI